MLAGLVDNRNTTLLNELKQNYKIEVKLVNDTDKYTCHSIDQKSTIYVPKTRICPESFTHELLHIFLRSKGSIYWRSTKKKTPTFKNFINNLFRTAFRAYRK